MIVFKASGDDNLFINESGCHTIQRVPNTEKKGRVQTSTISIATLCDTAETELIIDEKDLDYKTCRSGGPGGQAINKKSTAVQLTHLPTGIMVRIESRSQSQNKEDALKILQAKLYKLQQEKIHSKVSNERKEQIGNGSKDNKRRKLRFQDDQVIDYISGKKWRLKDYLKGNW